jgi:hypothetical protein
MTKPKWLIIISVIFFAIVNTSYFWEKHIGSWSMLTFLLLMVVYLGLFIVLVLQITGLFKSKFSDIRKLVSCFILFFSLLLVAVFPGGVIDFEKIMEGEDLFVATREGAANCMTYLKFKTGNRFIQRSVCFGVNETKGKYQLVNDTIKIEYDNNESANLKYAFGVIQKDKIDLYDKLGVVQLFQSPSDTIPIEYTIIKNAFN